MKNYKQLLKELPSKKVVFAFGRFQPPTTGHELLVNAVKKLAGSTADHVIYASKTEDKKSNPLPVARKLYFLKRMFPKTNFVAASAEVRTPIEAAKELNKKYKNLVMVAGSDRVAGFQKLLNDYNGKEYHFDTIEVVSAGERDPDSDTASGMSGTKMREAAVAGDFNKFKKGLPHTLTELDGRRLMNDIRKGLGHAIIKEQFVVKKDDLREKYFKGEIFNVGDIVESLDIQYEIVKRGSNHLLLKQEDGSLVSKWIQDVTLVEELKMNEELSDKTIKSSDKIKVARIIANTLGVENAEATSDPTQLVNSGLRKVRGKAFNADSLKIIGKMLELASEVGIQYDNNLVPTKLKEGTIQPNGTDKIDVNTSAPTDRTKTVYYKDFKNMLQKEAVTDDKDTESDHDKEERAKAHPHSEVGHSMTRATDSSNVRRQKVKYHLGESYEQAETHRAKATEAQKSGDAEKYHHHMSNHYEALSQWHSSKGRHNMADLTSQKADKHHEASINGGKLKTEEVTEEPAMKHRVAVTVSDPNHTAVSKRKEQVQKFAKVTAGSEADALKKAAAHFKKAGLKVHSTEHHSMVKEEISVLEDVDTSEYTIKKFVGSDDKTHERKVRPKRITFDTNKTDESVETDDAVLEATKAEMEKDKDYQDYKDPFFEDAEEEEMSDADMDAMINSTQDHEFLDAYDEDELHIIDLDTGEPVETDKEAVSEQALMEVLSRFERMRAKMRFAKTQAKRERRVAIALKTRSSSGTINKRARRMAIILMKKRIARKPLSQLSIGEKERLDKVVQQRKALIGRMAMKLTPRMRKIEQNRLTHTKGTAATSNPF